MHVLSAPSLANLLPIVIAGGVRSYSLEQSHRLHSCTVTCSRVPLFCGCLLLARWGNGRSPRRVCCVANGCRPWLRPSPVSAAAEGKRPEDLPEEWLTALRFSELSPRRRHPAVRPSDWTTELCRGESSAVSRGMESIGSQRTTLFELLCFDLVRSIFGIFNDPMGRNGKKTNTVFGRMVRRKTASSTEVVTFYPQKMPLSDNTARTSISCGRQLPTLECSSS